MKTVGFQEAESDTLWSVVAAVLHLVSALFSRLHSSWEGLLEASTLFPFQGAVTFHLDEEDASSVVLDPNCKHLQHVARLLGVTVDDLQCSLTERVVAARGDVIKKRHSSQEANYAKDAFAKALYDRMFSWIFQRINGVIDVKDSTTPFGGSTVIGVLDIYGFEIFESNRWVRWKTHKNDLPVV